MKQLFQRLTLLFGLTLFAQGAYADCETFGFVVNGDMYNGCGHMIVTADGFLLDVVDVPFPGGDLYEGDFIKFEYASSSYTSNCGVGEPIDVTCIELVEPSAYSGDMCEHLECVWPGDANGDQKANVYDLLRIGLGYGMEGEYRPQGTSEWFGQFGYDWGIVAPDGIDYKHFDSNGDGYIVAEDSDAILQNYQPEFNVPSLTTEETPDVYVVFEQETVVVNDDSPELIEIKADLYAGAELDPINDLHGLAMQLYYPQQDLVLPHSVTIEYDEESFFGSGDQVLNLNKDLYDLKRLDLGFSRKGGSSASGGGKVAELTFIVIADIIVARSENEVPFLVHVEGVRAVNGAGEPLDLEVSTQPASMTIINNTATSVSEATLGTQVKVSPNPSSDNLVIETIDLQTTHIEVYNSLGLLQRKEKFTDKQTQWSVAEWAPGVYWLKVYAEEGIATKRIMVE